MTAPSAPIVAAMSVAPNTPAAPTLDQILAATPYAGYSYAYPHKTAYRRFDPRPRLEEVWRHEDRSALFLYLHVPFCEMRCGFCNLFTQARPEDGVPRRYVEALEREARAVREALGEARFARFALGGGTPTQLEPELLARVLDVAESMGARLADIPACAETSPETATPVKLALLRERGIDRVSIGVQSFVPGELQALGRPQREAEVSAALQAIRDAGFPTLNIDLIYGMAGQTGASLGSSIDRALEWAPEEIYLYPLYVRPLTGLDRRGRRAFDGDRALLQRAGRDRLLERGYTQVSMRMFRAAHAPDAGGPAYCCQRDGMVGLGAGARSYTRGLHYSTEYAVAAKSVRGIIAEYSARPGEELARATVGFALDPDEQRRRYIIQSVLSGEGLARAPFRERFGVDPLDAYPMLGELVERGWARLDERELRLLPEGIAHSDVVGPWLYSPAVRARTEAYELR